MLISLGDALIAKEQKEPLSLHLLTRKYLLKALQLLVKVNISILIHSLRFLSCVVECIILYLAIMVE